MKQEQDEFSFFELVEIFAVLALIISGGYFIGSCIFTPTYEMDMMSGDYRDFHNAIAGKGDIDAITNSELKKFAVIIKDGVNNNNMDEIDQRLQFYSFSCEQSCSTESKPYQPTYGYPSYYPASKTVCSFRGCTETTYKGIEHIRKMREDGLLQKEKLQDVLEHYPTFGGWIKKVAFVWLGSFLGLFLILGFFITLSKGLRYRRDKHVEKIQKIHDKVIDKVGYRIPGLPDKANKESVRIVLDQGLVDDVDREQMLKSSRFL